MGKLSEEDFQILKRQYLQEAAGYMKEMDKLESLQATISKPVDKDLRKKLSKMLRRSAHLNPPKENTVTALLVAGRLLLRVDSVPLAGQIYTNTQEWIPYRRSGEGRWKN